MNSDKENQKSNAALREEAILAFWQEHDIFKKSLEKDAPKGEFVFYEGPPTANAKPALHHLEARAFKDVLPRYKTMQGFHVRRRAGWDTHGLPVELQIEKKLGLTNKKDIETYGIAQFNRECKESVFTYIHDWEAFTDRIGYWVDQEHAYYTFNTPYMESLWNILGTVEKRGLLYKDYKVVPWCPRCGTALASHELAQGYQDDKDLSVTAKFPLTARSIEFLRSSGRLDAQPQPDTQKSNTARVSFLAWTTTPWTLPGNVALAVGADIEYVEAKVGEEIVLLAKDRLSVLGEGYEVLAQHKGSELVGLEYEPLYPYLSGLITGSEKEKMQNAYKVYAADFVTTTDGTGIVHTAVMYGQDDFELGTKAGLPKFHTVDEAGHFIKGTDFLEGRFVKDEEVAIDIIKDLAHRGLLFKKEKYEHSYPHCWRCKTPLIYYARDSWYIAMSKLRDELVQENEGINWEPSHIKEGRFGEWLREIKDWAISRERYWGTPLPIWQSDDKERIVIDSVDMLRAHTVSSGNTYFAVRHGEATHNVNGLINCDPTTPSELTEQGVVDIKKSAAALRDKKITKVFSSAYPRTKRTAEIIAETLGLHTDIIFDERLNEFNVGVFNNENISEYHQAFPDLLTRFTTVAEGGETLNDVRKRMGDFIYELETRYKNETILIVSHGDPLWMLDAVVHGHSALMALKVGHKQYMSPGEIREIDFVPLPHNDLYELDLHRPYIDEIVLRKDGKEFKRVKEVMDVWFDSGSMPFAQDHYPFENKEWIEGKGYPADFISEAIDQTRGWFYTLHAIGTLLEKGKAYKNVICLGHLLDKDGKKMSKSIGNIVEPFSQIEKFGADAVRFWMYSVNQPGDSKNYDEKTVDEVVKKVFNLTYNVLSFYELYRDTTLEAKNSESNHVLDRWIIARLNELIMLCTESLDNFKLFEPTRAIRDFIDDMSTWYLRRSRDRIKDGDPEAKQTLYTVLKTLARIMAPFTPFAAEDIWQRLKTADDEVSVHLSTWPTTEKIDEEVIKNMELVRDICAEGNALRKKENIPVRQPLSKLEVVNYTLEERYTELIKEELNVKEVVEGKVTKLDTEISSALKSEGNYRELIRAVQDMRKAQGLQPGDVISLIISPEAAEFLTPFLEDFKKTVQAKGVIFAQNDGETILIDGTSLRVTIEK